MVSCRGSSCAVLVALLHHAGPHAISDKDERTCIVSANVFVDTCTRCALATRTCFCCVILAAASMQGHGSPESLWWNIAAK
jgi:hypothetical protein